MSSYSAFPHTRHRRMRTDRFSRLLMQETVLLPRHLIWAAFVCEGVGQRIPVPTLPGVLRMSIDVLVTTIREAQDLGILGVLLFPVVPQTQKTVGAEAAWDPDGLIPRAVGALKAACPAFGVFTDVALDPFTCDGQDGLTNVRGYVENDRTLTALVRQALSHAAAGCDAVAPSDMMDGRVGAIRTALEAQGHSETRIFSYSAKYASAFYGPFRAAVGSDQHLKGDKTTYQMDPANRHEALREVAQDLAEGADAIIVKPAMGYLDVLYAVKDRFQVPTFAYQVSGEYAMLRHAIDQEILGPEAFTESLLCVRRAGADAIVSYGALDFARGHFDTA